MVDFIRSIPIEFEMEDCESKYSTIFEFHIFRHPDPSRVNNVAALRVKRKPTGSLFMKPLEIEVKFYLPKPALIRNRILSIGAESKGRFFEINFCYDDNEKNLIKRKSLLRLRKDLKTTLTFKSQPTEKKEDFKILHELEVEVNNFQTMNDILEAIGFHKEQVYEKWRETLVLENTIFCIDTMPFGNFLEIEGTGPEIMKSASLLGLEWENRILFNYLSIYEKIQKKFCLPFSDVTFENFKSIDLPFDSFFHSLKDI